MKVRTLIFLGLLVHSTAFAQAQELQIESPRAKAAFRAAIKFLNSNPEKKANYLPGQYSFSSLGDQVSIEYLNSNGENSKTLLNTHKNSLLDLGTSLLWARDRRNMLSYYRAVYSALPVDLRKGLKKPARLKGLPGPSLKRATQLLLNKVRVNINDIIDRLNPAILAGTSTNPIGTCALEVGFEVAGAESESSQRCELSEYDVDGLFLNIDFPLKDNLTCIKNQGARGTCVAHTIAAAVESLEMVDGGQPENLSEQHIYHRAETEGDSQVSPGDMQVYGLFMDIAVDAFNRQNLGIFYEEGWNYNQSIGMGAGTLNSLLLVNYPDSCSQLLYTGEACTGYAWQTGVTVNIPGIPLPDAPPVMSGAPAHTIVSDLYFPMDGGGIITLSSLYSAIPLLATDTPLLLALSITNFFQISLDGYVLDIGFDPVVGGHAMLMVGFVPNSQLPAGAVPATEEGYFIIKNSWGTNSGDCGFYYLDFAYVRSHAHYISMIDIS